MRIAVLAHALRGGGGLSAGRSMLSALARVGQEHRYLFIMPDKEEYRSVALDADRHETFFYGRKYGHLGRLLFDRFDLCSLVERFSSDAILALGNRGLHNPSSPQAILCRDAHFFYPAKNFGTVSWKVRAKVACLKSRLRKDMRHSQLVLCQTETARKRLLDTYGYEGRIAVCGNAISTETLKSVATDIPRLPSHLRDKIKLFCLARYYPQKNLESIVEMYRDFSSELGDVVTILTISPDQHPNARKLLQRIAALGLSETIVNVGPLSQSEIAGYYRQCQALLFPTLLESFSRTYIEAMNFGLPILTSDLDFAHEICGDAALYFNPWSTESMLGAIEQLNGEASLSQVLVEKGKAQLEQYGKSWDDVAGIVLDEMEGMVQDLL